VEEFARVSMPEDFELEMVSMKSGTALSVFCYYCKEDKNMSNNRRM
jgi:hypothetical protein